MDTLFSNLAIQTVQLVGKAAFGAASSMAVKKVTEFINQVPTSETVEPELERLQSLFEMKLQIITPTIDIIEIISARGYSTMTTALQLTHSLRRDIVNFTRQLSDIDGTPLSISPHLQKSDKSLISLFQRNRDKSSSTASLGDLEAATARITRDLRYLLGRIDDAVPLLSLALTTSGVHLSNSLPDNISPSRLLQASTILTQASHRLELLDMHNKDQPEHAGEVIVGSPIILRLYSLFTGSVRPKSKLDFTWKEEFAKCKAELWRIKSTNDSLSEAYKYELRITEDLNDGRYHSDDEEKHTTNEHSSNAEFAYGRSVKLSLDRIKSLHYTLSGSLLNIEDSKSPVLVLCSQDQDAVDGAGSPKSPNHTPKCNKSQQNKTPYASESPSSEWFALEVLDEYESSEDSDDDANDDNDDSEASPQTSSDAISLSSDAKTAQHSNENEVAALAIKLGNDCSIQEPNNTDLPQDNLETSDQYDAQVQAVEALAHEWNMCTLSLLEYMICLASVEMSEQVTHLEVPDEKLYLYLSNEPTTHAVPSAAPLARSAAALTPRTGGQQSLSYTPGKLSARHLNTMHSPLYGSRSGTLSPLAHVSHSADPARSLFEMPRRTPKKN